jgi:hypothetical protein
VHFDLPTDASASTGKSTGPDPLSEPAENSGGVITAKIPNTRNPTKRIDIKKIDTITFITISIKKTLTFSSEGCWAVRYELFMKEG